MESITSLKAAATRAIWGEEQANQEPISGQTGDVSKGEPYDAGNMGEPQEVTKFTAPDETETQPDTSTKLDAAKETKPDTEEKTEKEAGKKHEVNPASIDSSTTKTDSTKAQNDVRDPSDPSAQHENAEPKQNVDDTDGLDTGDNPDKIDGPGPRPLEEVAREHGGDAGRSGSDESLGATEQSPQQDVEGSSHDDSGTGEQYVKSSGLKADGGDFDAAAPGAGREADRLLENKGVHREGANGGIVPNDTNGHANGHANGTASSPAGKEKTSLKAKIKAKLHRNSLSAS